MQQLKNSGLQIHLQEDENKLVLDATLTCDKRIEKTVGQMIGLLADEEDLDLSERFYDVYRGIYQPEDRDLFRNYKFQYDITVVMGGLVNGECKKTSGHFHGYNPQRSHTYPEVYEVIYGNALYVLQKAEDFEADFQNMEIQDVILVNVDAGETIIIPPDYGHCSINIGNGPMIFSNLAYEPCPIHYDAIRFHHGMSYYIFNENENVTIKRNKNYSELPEPKFARIKQNRDLGIEFGKPVYQSFLENPAAFDFLGNPDPYMDEIMSMLVYRKNY
jgi:glucose-6-phosphate isomerase